MNLSDAPLGTTVTIETVGGHGSFRRRLLELGLLPGTTVTLMSIAPLGDPLELLVRGSSLSIRRAQAVTVEISINRRHSVRSESASPGMSVGGWAGSTP